MGLSPMAGKMCFSSDASHISACLAFFHLGNNGA